MRAARLTLLSLLLLACGGAEERPDPAPLPDSWVRQDEEQGQDTRPRGFRLGEEPGSETTGGEAGTGGWGQTEGSSATAPPPGAAQNERAAFAALADEYARLWNLEPGRVRARAACEARGRLTSLASEWLRAAAAAHPDQTAQIDRASEPLSASFTALDDWCREDMDRDGPGPVEASLQELGDEIERLELRLRQ